MRNYVRKSDCGKFSREAMLTAVGLVENGTIRKAASAEGVNYKTLSRYVKIKSTKGNLDRASFGYVKSKQVFSDDMEKDIVDYIVHALSLSWIDSS